MKKSIKQAARNSKQTKGMAHLSQTSNFLEATSSTTTPHACMQIYNMWKQSMARKGDLGTRGSKSVQSNDHGK